MDGKDTPLSIVLAPLCSLRLEKVLLKSSTAVGKSLGYIL